MRSVAEHLIAALASELPIATGAGLNQPTTLPPRRHKKALSNLFILSRGGERVYVPKNAIYRNHGCAPLQPVDGMCFNSCDRRDGCGHNWRSIHPKDVIVLGARDHEANLLFGWYVRFAHDEHSVNRLFRVPEILARDVVKFLSKDEELCRSSLLEHYLDHRLEVDVTLAWQSFDAIAATRYTRIRETLATQAYREKKRKRIVEIRRERSKEQIFEDDEKPEEKVAHRVPRSPEKGVGDEACAVCLEDNIATKKACCGISVCGRCDDGLRGLCPVCDRSRCNGRYVCSCCGEAVPLRSFAFPCVHCDEPCLCISCFSSFEECVDCEKLAFDIA